MVILSTALVACGGSGAPDAPNPEDAAQEAIQAVMNADFDTYESLLCDSLKADFANLRASGRPLLIVDDYDLGALRYDVEILEDTVVNEDSTDDIVDARVDVTGAITYTFFDETIIKESGELFNNGLIVYQIGNNWRICTLAPFAIFEQ